MLRCFLSFIFGTLLSYTIQSFKYSGAEYRYNCLEEEGEGGGRQEKGVIRRLEMVGEVVMY